MNYSRTLLVSNSLVMREIETLELGSPGHELTSPTTTLVLLP